jgi:cbb3-type cytochrome oxidase maturation protein
MDILFLLVPVSVVLALAIVGLLAWAVWSGQFEDMEGEGQRIFQDFQVQILEDDKISKTISR